MAKPATKPKLESFPGPGDNSVSPEQLKTFYHDMLLIRRFEDRLLYAPTEGEVRSWTNSLPAVARELAAAGLEDLGR